VLKIKKSSESHLFNHDMTGDAGNGYTFGAGLAATVKDEI
jgi:hypothetical protein